MDSDIVISVPSIIEQKYATEQYFWPPFIANDEAYYLSWAFDQGITRNNIWDISNLTSSEKAASIAAASLFKRGGTIKDQEKVIKPKARVLDPKIDFLKGDGLGALKKTPTTLIVMDMNFAKSWNNLEPYFRTEDILISTITEKNKTIKGLREDTKRLDLSRIDTVIAFGGGVILDCYGFLASLISAQLIYVPTTTLSMIDVCIGGKNGVNTNHGKNQLGRFYGPDKIYFVLDFLNTLDKNQYNSGIYEHIKHLIIAGRTHDISIDLFENKLSKKVINESLKIKEEIVKQDALEEGKRKLLNFGHSIGHALESFYLNPSSNKKNLLHGEAVALGMVVELYLNYMAGKISKKYFESVHAKLTKLETFADLNHYLKDLSKNDFNVVLKYLESDKKNTLDKKASISVVSDNDYTGYELKQFTFSLKLEIVKLWTQKYIDTYLVDC